MNVLVTGASGGLGAAVTRAFLERGAAVIGVARSAPANASYVAVAADLTTAEGCRSAVASALEHGPVDALVHLLGGFAGGKAVAEEDDATWDGMINLNLHAAFYAMRAVLPTMIAARRGRILAIGSRAAVEPMASLAAYSVSKAALVTLVKTVALETRDLGVTANVVLPSVIDTAQNRAAMPKADFSNWVKPEAIAKLLVWLAADAPGDVSGAVIPIYGRV